MPKSLQQSRISAAMVPGRAGKSILFLIILGIVLVSCTPSSSPDPQLQVLQTLAAQTQAPSTETTSPTSTSNPSPSPSPTKEPIGVWLPGYLPDMLRSRISLPEGYLLTDSKEKASISLQVERAADADIQWIYALVAPFPTVTDGVTEDELKAAWEGSAAGPFEGVPLLMDESTLNVLSDFIGPPAEEAVQVLPAEELLETTWSGQPAWAIVPFEQLGPRWKVLEIEGLSPIRKNFEPADYLLTVPFAFSGSEEVKPEDFDPPTTNREADRMTTVVMTGVTALVRATASTMEWKGINYPAEDIGELLRQADITHISNEIPFSPDCPKPSWTSTSLVFCSDPKYMELLETVGTDVIELTGDHFMDYRTDATLYTLGIYDDADLPYYGGGADARSARQPVLFENNGNKIAFLGCNIGCEIKTSIPCTALATEEHPGAAKCDFDWIKSEISRLRQDGYQVIFSFQHIEYYKYTIERVLEQSFTQVAEAGAVIVSGSQAHQPHGFSFYNDAILHYGLGNLFFDQYHFCADFSCDNAFIDRHVFYDGQYISTELITIRFVDFARPRLMTPAERKNFLEIIFNASKW